MKRNPGWFTSENNPRPGGKKGRRWSRSEVRLRVERMVQEELDRILGLARENIEAAINAGDLKMSAWFVQEYNRRMGTRLLQPLKNAVERIEDVEEVSKESLLMAIQGTMSFEELQAIQEALARHSVLSGMVELRKLRAELEEIQEETGVGDKASQGVEHLPAWGRLKAITDTPQAEDIEAVAQEVQAVKSDKIDNATKAKAKKPAAKKPAANKKPAAKRKRQPKKADKA